MTNRLAVALVIVLIMLSVFPMAVSAQDPIGGALQTLTMATAYVRQTDAARQQQQWNASQTDTALRQGAELARQTSSAADAQAKSASASLTAVSASATQQYLDMQRSNATETRRADFATSTAIAAPTQTAMSARQTVESGEATRQFRMVEAQQTATVVAMNNRLAAEERDSRISSAGLVVVIALIVTATMVALFALIKQTSRRPVAEREPVSHMQDPEPLENSVVRVVFDPDFDALIEREVASELTAGSE